MSVFRTNLDAPNYRLIAIDFEHPERENWKTIVEASETDVLDWAVCVNKDKLLTCYVHDVKVNILFVDSEKLESYLIYIYYEIEYSSTEGSSFGPIDQNLLAGCRYRPRSFCQN